MIVKVQKAITPPGAPALVYDRSRSLMLHVPMTPELEAKFGARLKIYCEATYDEDNLQIHYIVQDRSW